MNNRWFTKEGKPKRHQKKRWGYYQEYANLKKDWFMAHRIQDFLNDFRKIYPTAPDEEVKSRLVGFIGLYNNQYKCAPQLFNAERYRWGCILLIGEVDEHGS